ncbi:MAG: elongation factor G [Candidatus Aureabacteria bacterium]|nr:elongation factor G [Candidatus Auribacterota bacterium]
MKDIKVSEVRNVAFIGHSSSGKTSIIDAILHDAKVSDRLGKVSEGTSYADYTKEERDHKITIYTKPFHCIWDKKSLFMSDNPGYIDFVGEVHSSLRIADSAILVVDGTSGVEVGTTKGWNVCEQFNIPRMIFINKLDKENVDFFKVVEELKDIFGDKCIPFQIPIEEGPGFKGVINVLEEAAESKVPDSFKEKFAALKQKITELVAETDDNLIEKYLDQGTLEREEILSVLGTAVNNLNVIPILCGSAEKEIGIDELLDLVNRYMPSPEKRGEVEGEDGVKRKPSSDDPFSAFVYKSISDVYVGQMNLVRIYSGKLTAHAHVYNPIKGESEKIGDILLFQGKEKPKSVEEAGPGDIIALTKLKITSSGDTLCSDSSKITYPKIVFPKPNTFVAVETVSKGDEDKISSGLHKIAAEDNTITMKRNKETKELVLGGLGDVHLDIIVGKLKDRFKVDVKTQLPKVPYKESITKASEGHIKYKKQSGGRGQYGEVYLRVAPKQRGEGFEFVDEVVGGVIPRNFIPAVEKGVVGAMAEGVIGNYPVVDIQTTVYDGSYHPVDSSEMAFKIAGSKAFKEAMESAKPILLEPIMSVTINVPADCMGDVTGDLNSNRGRILGMLPKGNFQEIKANVPIAEMYKFPKELRSITGGRGTFEMEFDHYEKVPQKLADDISKLRKQEKEA